MRNLLIAVGIALLLSAPVYSQEYSVGQKNKTFTQKELNIKVGDTVRFQNNDPFFHNVYSLSDGAMFDLGSYPRGESKAIEFKEAGVMEVECAIHARMLMIIRVSE